MDLVTLGVIATTVGVLLALYQAYRKHPSLRVHVHLCRADGSYARGGSGFTYLSFEVLNSGQVPVVLSGVGSSGKRATPLVDGAGGSLFTSQVNDDSLPRQLDPGHCYRGLSPLPTSIVSEDLVLSDIWAEDSLGRKYRTKRHRLRQLQAELSESLQRALRNCGG